MKSILNGWKKILEKAESGEKPLHRNRDFEKEKRIKEKETKKLNWFKGKDGKAFESVIMIPATHQGELKKINNKLPLLNSQVWLENTKEV